MLLRLSVVRAARGLSVHSGVACQSSISRPALPSVRCCSEKSLFTKRSHTCGELRRHHAGQNVTLYGWMQRLRNMSQHFQFVPLRDSYGTTLLIVEDQELWRRVKDVPVESVLKVEGRVRPRPEKDINKAMDTGEIEVQLLSLEILNKAERNMPLQLLGSSDLLTNEKTRLENRPLDIRQHKLQRLLRFRSDLVHRLRRRLVEEYAFVEVETPTLVRRSPGGAREFLVPTREKDRFYALVQSPQQMKQMLMCGGIDRYFQFARCYRDEGGRGDRQPEFTQLDLELSFTSQADIEDLIERLLRKICPSEQWPHLPAFEQRFPRLTYSQAMAQYGTDKPDLRFDMKICDLSSIKHDPFFNVPQTLQAIRIPKGSALLSNRKQKGLRSLAEGLFVVGLDDSGQWPAQLAKQLSCDTIAAIDAATSAQPTDILLILPGDEKVVLPALGKLRLHCARLLEAHGVPVFGDGFCFAWIEDFPLFCPPEEDNGKGDTIQVKKGAIQSSHHPFTAPHPEDVHLLATDPMKVRGQHFDLVLNGVEVGGGSMRVHDREMQRHILCDILKLDEDDFIPLLKMLTYGCPPHGGIALGLDRLVATFCQSQSLRGVLAFPKSSHGCHDLYLDAPCAVTDAELHEYHLTRLPPNGTYK